jgi:hypothetical protein
MLPELGWIGHRALLKALRGSIKDSLRSLRHKVTPGLKLDEPGQIRADLAGQIRLHQLNLSPMRWKHQHLTTPLHGRKIEIGQHHFV